MRDGPRRLVGEGSVEGAPATGGVGSGARSGVDTGAGGCGSRRRAQPAPATRKWDGCVDGERSEAEGGERGNGAEGGEP